MKLKEHRVIGPQGLMYRAIQLGEFMPHGIFVAAPNEEIQRIHNAQPHLFMGCQEDDWLLIPVNGLNRGRSCIVGMAAFRIFQEEAGLVVVDLDSADFSDALMWLKEGKCVARRGWNGNNQWAVLINPGNAMYTKHGQSAPMQPCFGLKNEKGEMQPGWTPSSGDLLADDWMIVQ